MSKMAMAFIKGGSFEKTYAKPYPKSRHVWKKNIVTAHPAGDPPTCGSIILPNMGWTEKTRVADKNSVKAKR